MSEMIDRVASAILMRSRSVMGGPNYPTPDDAAHLARAAIEAMRDPSEPMLEAATDNSHWGSKICYRAMIDAALSSEQAAVK